MGKITRSLGIEVPNWAGPRPGGGYRGINEKLDAAIADAAAALERVFGVDVEIRFNSDRLSGGAFIVRSDGATVGVTYAWAACLRGPRTVADRTALRYPSVYPTRESLVCLDQDSLRDALTWLEMNVAQPRTKGGENGQL